MPGSFKSLTNPRSYVLVALIGTLAASLLAFAAIVVGFGGPNVVAFGIVTTTLFVFILTLHASYGKGDNKEDFLRKGSVRTAIATSLTVAYVSSFQPDPAVGAHI